MRARRVKKEEKAKKKNRRTPDFGVSSESVAVANRACDHENDEDRFYRFRLIRFVRCGKWRLRVAPRIKQSAVFERYGARSLLRVIIFPPLRNKENANLFLRGGGDPKLKVV